MTPTKEPRVELAGTTYTLKYGPTAEYMVDQLGVDISIFLRSLADNEHHKTPKRFSTFLGMFSAMVAHHFVRLKQEPLTPLQWSAVLEDMTEADRLVKVGEMANSVMAVLMPKLQASAQTVKLQEPAPRTELPPLT